MSNNEENGPDLFHYIIMWKTLSGCPYSDPSPPTPLAFQLSSMDHVSFSPRSGYPQYKESRGQFESTLQCMSLQRTPNSIHHSDIWKGKQKWQAVSSGLILSHLIDLLWSCWHRNTLTFRFYYIVKIICKFFLPFVRTHCFKSGIKHPKTILDL